MFNCGMARCNNRETIMKKMRMVRIYVMEAEKQLPSILKYLHDTAKVRGVTIFRGVSGYGQSGAMHTSHLVDLSLNLPIAVEFFDNDPQIQEVIQYLKTIIEPGHLATWEVEVNLP